MGRFWHTARETRRTRQAGAHFLSHLKERGLSGVRLFISDACLGLAESAAEFFPEAAWQRCVVGSLKKCPVMVFMRLQAPRRLHSIGQGFGGDVGTRIGPSRANQRTRAQKQRLPAALPKSLRKRLPSTTLIFRDCWN